MLLKDFIVSSRRALSDLYPEGEARALVSGLCSSLLGVSPQAHLLDPGLEIEAERLPRLEAALARLLKGEPLQYVLGEAWFLGHRFKVNPSVLIPRPETEEMVALALREARNRAGLSNGNTDKSPSDCPVRGPRVLDLCTGSGCIAWSMALELPRAEVLAVDISPEALEMAASQFGDSPVRPKFVAADVLQPELLLRRLAEAEDKSPETASQVRTQFDIFLSNPPYVRESEKALMHGNVLDWEPEIALFVPDDDALRFYRAEAEIAASVLSEGGFGIVEINEAFGRELAGLFSDAGLKNVRVLKDLSGRERFVSFCSSVR